MAGPNVLVLIDDRGKRYLVSLDSQMVRVEGLGVFDTAKLLANLGHKILVGKRSVLALPASRRDRMAGLERGPQTIGTKDAAAILFWADISPDATVVEAGTGSGWLTVALAIAVGPRGRVITYERRRDFSSLAGENLRRAGVIDRVEIRVADIRSGIPERDLDAVVLDIPDPWTVAEVAWDALRIGGSIASFSPNVEQVREMVAALARPPYVDLHTIEVIERELEVRDTGTRPSHAPLGHTGYVTVARKVLDNLA